MDKQVTLTVNVNELNTILTGLGQLPYAQVFQLINALQAQIQPQMRDNMDAK